MSGIKHLLEKMTEASLIGDFVIDEDSDIDGVDTVLAIKTLSDNNEFVHFEIPEGV